MKKAYRRLCGLNVAYGSFAVFGSAAACLFANNRGSLIVLVVLAWLHVILANPRKTASIKFPDEFNSSTTVSIPFSKSEARDRKHFVMEVKK